MWKSPVGFARSRPSRTNCVGAPASTSTRATSSLATCFPALYPEGLTVQTQLVLGILVLVVNVALYGWLLRARRAGAGRINAR